MNSEYFSALKILEQEHIKYHMVPMKHVQIHWLMLKLAWKYKVAGEFLGQIPRLLLAAPGSLLKKAPKGNVGSTRMGIFETRE